MLCTCADSWGLLYCQALRAFRVLRVAAAAGTVACLLGLAAALGGGAGPAAAAPAALGAGAALSGLLYVWFGRWVQKFIYVGWDHSTNH